jgi:hypothetical protein
MQFIEALSLFRDSLNEVDVNNPLWLIMKGDELEGVDALLALGEKLDKNILIRNAHDIVSELIENNNDYVIFWLPIRGDVEILMKYREMYKKINETKTVKIFPYRRLSDTYKIIAWEPEIEYGLKYETLLLSDTMINVEKNNILQYAKKREEGAVMRIFFLKQSTGEGRKWFLNNIQRNGPFANQVKEKTLRLDGVVD